MLKAMSEKFTSLEEDMAFDSLFTPTASGEERATRARPFLIGGMLTSSSINPNETTAERTYVSLSLSPW